MLLFTDSMVGNNEWECKATNIVDGKDGEAVATIKFNAGMLVSKYSHMLCEITHYELQSAEKTNLYGQIYSIFGK